MKIFTCAPEWEAMLTTIYEAWSSKAGHKNIKLMVEPVGQQSFFDEYIHVDADKDKADKVKSAIIEKISAYVYRELAFTAVAYEEDVLDNIYRVLLLGFSFGKDVLNMVQYKDVMRNNEIRKRVSREANRFQEVLRFHQLGDVYIAHYEPKSRVTEFLGYIFQDRMPSEKFVIVDDIHKEAAIHNKDEDFYMWKLTEEELKNLLKSEDENDEYTDLWKLFYETIAIKERENEKLRTSMFPKWARAHAVEFFP